MTKSLQQFYADKDMKENVKNYLVNFLEQEAVRKIFAKEDVNGIAEAKEVIEKAFYNLEVLFEPKPKTKEIVNEAR